MIPPHVNWHGGNATGRRQSAPFMDFVVRGRAASGIKDLTPRMCRTTFATLWRGDPRDVQDILGHHSLKLTLDVYKKPLLERQQATVSELEARLSGKVVPMKKRAQKYMQISRNPPHMIHSDAENWRF